MGREIQSEEREMSTAEAIGGKVRRVVALESSGWGDQRNAVERISSESRIPFWTLDNLRTGRAKTVEGSVINRFNRWYLEYLERKVASIQHEITIEKAKNDDADLDLLETEVAALLRKIAERKASV